MANRQSTRINRSNQKAGGAPTSSYSGTLFSSHWETAKDSTSRLLRTPAASLMTALVIAIALLLPGFLRQIEINLNPVTDNFQDSARITLFLHPDTSEQRGLELSEDLLNNYDTVAADYLSSADALTEFRANSGFASLIDDLEENPLPASITLVPQQQAAADVEALAADLENLPEVEAISVDLDWIQRLSAVSDLIARLRILLASILALAVVLIIGNTTRMSIENRAREIEVVKLVGGTSSFIARPFLYSGLLLGTAGGLLAGLILLGVQSLVSMPIDTLLSFYSTELTIQQPGAADVILSTAIGAALGWFGALVSMLMRLYSAPP